MRTPLSVAIQVRVRPQDIQPYADELCGTPVAYSLICRQGNVERKNER